MNEGRPGGRSDALDAGADGVRLSPEYLDYFDAVVALDDASTASNDFEDALSAWEDLVALDAQATDLETGLTDAIAAIENAPDADPAGLGIDLVADGGVLTANSDLYIFDADDGDVAFGGTAFGDGTDYIYMGGNYTYVEASIETTAADYFAESVGSASALEIFALEDADGLGVTLYIEDVATAGNGTTTADLTEIRLEGITLDDLSFNSATDILTGSAAIV